MIGSEQFYSHPALGSLVVVVANKRTRQGHQKLTSKGKEIKCLVLLSEKAYSTISLQMRLSSYQAVLVNYDYIN